MIELNLQVQVGSLDSLPVGSTHSNWLSLFIVQKYSSIAV